MHLHCYWSHKKTTLRLPRPVIVKSTRKISLAVDYRSGLRKHMDTARGPYVSVMAAAATAVATAGIAWYLLRRRDPDEALLQALVLREAVDRERSLRLGPLSAVHVIPRAEGRSSSAGVAAAQIGEDASARPITVFFVHGMWHGAWYFRALQKLLADQGVGSYAVTLNAGLTVDLDQHVKDVAAALASSPVPRAPRWSPQGPSVPCLSTVSSCERTVRQYQ